MKKIWRLVVALLCIGTATSEVQAGVGSGINASFNSFNYTQNGTVSFLGIGEGSSIPLSLTTTFDISLNPSAPVSLVLTMTQGPGVLNVPFTVNNNVTASPLCTSVSAGFSCTFTAQMNFEPGVIIQPGTEFGLTGQLTVPVQPEPLATAQDSFVAIVPEPSSVGLLALSLMTVSLVRRRSRA